MIQTKIDFHKEDGIQYKHLIQSFADYDKIIPEVAYKIGKDFLRHPMFDGFQMLMAVHRDKEHLHIHYVINSVNSDTGRKWNQTKQDLYRLRDYSDKLCRENNLVVIPATKNGNVLADGEYRNRLKGTSWKHELWLAVNNTLKFATGKDDFIKKMKSLGYGVSWTDSRKYITFITEDGKKCRNNKLYPPENFTKEEMERTFLLNSRYNANNKNDTEEYELLIRAVIFLLENGDDNEKRYPLSHLEGKALNEYYEEKKKGLGYEREHER